MQSYNSLFAVCTSQAPQLARRSSQDTLFDTNTKFSTHNSQLAVHRIQLASHFPFTDATSHASQLLVPTQLLIVHRSRFAARCSYLQYVFHNSPITFCRAQPTLESVNCSQCTILFMIHNSQCSLLNSADHHAQKATRTKKRVPIVTLLIEDFGTQITSQNKYHHPNSY